MTLDPQLVGLAIIAAVLLITGFISFRKQPLAIKLFGLALAVVGIGYLATTPAPTEIAQAILGQPK